MSSESALVKPFNTVFRFIGGFVDAVYYFFQFLINPNYTRRDAQLYSHVDRSNRSGGSGGSGGSGPRNRINTLWNSRGSGPDMRGTGGGCMSCG